MTRYYYAGGRRIALEADPELVAVDEKRAEAAGVRPEIGDVPVRRLPGGVMLLPRSSLDERQLAALNDAGALRPVYRHDSARLVAAAAVALSGKAMVAASVDCPRGWRGVICLHPAACAVSRVWHPKEMPT